jgi:hypothetical protein
VRQKVRPKKFVKTLVTLQQGQEIQ